jgi:hypothetical protein
MNFTYSAVIILAAAACAPPVAASPLPPPGLQTNEPSGIVKVQCEDPCDYYSHSRWRSHYRYSSQGEGYWHERWRSHFRWSSYGGYWHSRSWSHNRWGSYHRLPCYRCGWDE